MNRNNSTNLWAQLRILLLLLALSFPTQGIFAAGDPAKTKALITILGSQAELRDKSRACKDAGAFGTAEIVPVLAGLLSDEKLAAYARGSLEIIPEEAAREALRTALSQLKGKYLAGVINSLGNLRDEKSAPALRKLATDPAKGVATHALMALGRIADPESLKLLSKMLTTEPAGSNGDAALACLLAAERQLQLGNATQAQEICDSIIASKAPLAQKVAAVRGSIVARKDKAGPFLLVQLKSQNPALRDAALLGVREIPSKTAGVVLKEAFKEAQPEQRQMLLRALVECDLPSAAEVARANLDAEDSGLRTTALKAFSRSVGPADCEVLIASLQRTPEEAAIAYAGLVKLVGAEIDSKILTGLDAAKTPKLKTSLIELLADRYASNATAKLLQLATDPDKEVKLAACNALRALAKPQDLPALITLIKGMPQGTARAAVGIAIASVARQVGQPASEQILAEYNSASDIEWKKDWGAMLISIGYQPFLPIVQSLIQSGDPALADSLILKLGRWPNPAPIQFLLPQLSGSQTGRSRRALTAIVELAVSSIQDKKQPVTEIIDLFRQLQKSANKVEDKRLVISGLGNLKHRESIKMLTPYYEDQEVKGEATAAILTAGDRLSKNTAVELVPLLHRIIKETDSKPTRAKAERMLYLLKRSTPAAPAEA
ncbi:MAG: HEAT repeat domain-containing protein [Verrucomicrobia bacterium]|nr:HEAT repeat domain-containing protein [Verrucomicrobiota bacterium]